MVHSVVSAAEGQLSHPITCAITGQAASYMPRCPWIPGWPAQPSQWSLSSASCSRASTHAVVMSTCCAAAASLALPKKTQREESCTYKGGVQPLLLGHLDGGKSPRCSDVFHRPGVEEEGDVRLAVELSRVFHERLAATTRCWHRPGKDATQVAQQAASRRLTTVSAAN